MLRNRKIFSIYYYVKKEYRFVVFFTLLFSIISLLLTQFMHPIFNTGSRMHVSGSSSMLSSLASQIPFGISMGGGALTDELELLSSLDLKKKVFEQSDAKILWGKVDPEIRHFIEFDSIPLTEEPRKIKIVVKSQDSYEIFIEKLHHGPAKIFSKLPFTTFNQYGEGKSGEIVNINNSFNMLITSNDLKIGRSYIIEIGYRFPKYVQSQLFNKISFSNAELSSIIDIITTGEDAIKIVDLNLQFFETYMESRYKDVVDDKGDVVSIIDTKIVACKLKIDSLSKVQQQLSIDYKIISPDDEAAELFKTYSSYYKTRSSLTIDQRLNRKLSPYDSVRIVTNKLQLREINREMDKIQKLLYTTYPSAVVDFYTIRYQLEGESAILRDLVVKKESASISEIMEIGNRKLIQKPRYPFSRAKPQRAKMLIKYFMFGLFAGLFHLLFIRYKNSKFTRCLEVSHGLVFTLPKSGEKVTKRGYINNRIATLVDDKTLVGFYGGADEMIVTLIKESHINEDIEHNIMDHIAITSKKSVLVFCKYDEFNKSDLVKLEDKFDDRIILVFFDIEYDKQEYFYDKFVDDTFLKEIGI